MQLVGNKLVYMSQLNGRCTIPKPRRSFRPSCRSRLLCICCKTNDKWQHKCGMWGGNVLGKILRRLQKPNVNW